MESSERSAKHLRTLFPNDVNKAIQELEPLPGVTKRKLDKLLGYVYNVEAKDISRTALTALKRRQSRQSRRSFIKHGGKQPVAGKLCGSIGGRKEDPLKKCNSRDQKPTSDKRSSRGHGGGSYCQTTERTRSSKRMRRGGSKKCVKHNSRQRRARGGKSGSCKYRHGRKPCSSGKCKSKRSSRKRSKSRSKRRIGSSGKCKSKRSNRKRSKSRSKRGGGMCGIGGGGGCEQRHGRKPCSSGKCRSRRSGKGRTCNPGTCGTVTVIYPPVIPINKSRNNPSTSCGKPTSTKDSGMWYFT